MHTSTSSSFKSMLVNVVSGSSNVLAYYALSFDSFCYMTFLISTIAFTLFDEFGSLS
jgi:hypothetical protein